MKDRIREDSPEARPILEKIDEISARGESRHKATCWDIRVVTHPSDYLTPEEKTLLHDLKMSLRPKSRDEAHADLMRKRAERLKNKIV